MPAPVVERLNAALRAFLDKAHTVERIRGLGGIISVSSPAEYGTFLREDLDR